MKIEFDFEEGEAVAVQGVAALYCLDPDGHPLVLYGNTGEPNALGAVGLYSVAVDDAKARFAGGVERNDGEEDE